MKHVIAAAALLALTACASPDADFYRPADQPGEYGYTEIQLDDDRYRVSFVGDGTTSEEAVRELALLRAAELTANNDYDWFRIVSEETEETATVVTRPEETTTTIVTGDGDSAIRVEEGQEVIRECGPLGCTTTITPDYTGPEVVTVRDADHFTTTIEIEMGDGDVVNPSTVYNASALYGYLEDRYNT